MFAEPNQNEKATTIRFLKFRLGTTPNARTRNLYYHYKQPHLVDGTLD